MELKLSAVVVSKVDVARMLRELQDLDEFLLEAAIRKTGEAMKLPRMSRPLEEISRDNNYNLLDPEHRKELSSKLNVVLGKSPMVHMSFAAEPSARAIARIIEWFRTNVHPQILLQVGLQPTIAAGCVVRTPNLFFDLSLRHHLKQQEPYLIELIEEVRKRER